MVRAGRELSLQSVGPYQRHEILPCALPAALPDACCDPAKPCAKKSRQNLREAVARNPFPKSPCESAAQSRVGPWAGQDLSSCFLQDRQAPIIDRPSITGNLAFTPHRAQWTPIPHRPQIRRFCGGAGAGAPVRDPTSLRHSALSAIDILARPSARAASTRSAQRGPDPGATTTHRART